MKTMKRYLLRVLPVMVTVAMLMVSCSKGADEGAFIPKNASVIFHINVASLWQKADLANADNLQMMNSLHEAFQVISPKGDQLVEAFLKDPTSCGIDFKKPVCVFSEPFTEGPINTEYTVASAKLQSRKDFDKFVVDLEEVVGEKFKHCDTLDMTVIELGENELLAYNNSRLFFIENFPQMINGILDDPSDEVLTSTQYLAKLLNLKKEESMASNKYFDKYLADSKDISYFMSYGNMLNITITPMNSILMKFYSEKDLKEFEEASVCIYTSFENGRIELTSKTYGIPEVLQKFGSHKFNEELLTYLPAQTLAALTVSADVKDLVEYIDSLEDGELNLDESLGIDDYTIRDLINALGGSMAASFYGMQEGTPYFTAAIDLNNSDLARNLLNELAVNNGNTYSFEIFPDMQLVLNDKVAVLSTDPAVIANAQAGGKSNGLMAIADKAKKGNYFYMDLKLANWPTELLALIGIDSMPIVSSIFAMFDYIEAETINDQDGICNIYLSSDKTNSLAYILQEVDKMI